MGQSNSSPPTLTETTVSPAFEPTLETMDPFLREIGERRHGQLVPPKMREEHKKLDEKKEPKKVGHAFLCFLLMFYHQQPIVVEYTGKCYMVELPRPLLVVLATIIVDKKTKQNVVSLVSFSSSCKRLHSILSSQDTWRLLSEYQKFVSEKGIASLMRLFSLATVNELKEVCVWFSFFWLDVSINDCFSYNKINVQEQQDWRIVFGEKFTRQCSKCLRFFWVDDDVSGWCKSESQHRFIEGANQRLVLKALDVHEKQVRLLL